MTTIAPMLAVRTAVIGESQNDALLREMRWYTNRATDAPLYAVWDVSSEDAIRDAVVFRRGSVTLNEEFSLFADATIGRTAQEVVYAAYAALKLRVDAKPLTLGTDPNGTGLVLVRITLSQVYLMDDPDVEGRAHLRVGLRATIWSTP